MPGPIKGAFSAVSRRCGRFSVLPLNWRIRRSWTSRQNQICVILSVIFLIVVMMYFFTSAKSKQSTLLCVAILSTPSHEGREKRAACRESWLTLGTSEGSTASKSFFFLGQPKPQSDAEEPQNTLSSIQRSLQEEQRQYGDLVHLPLEDHYTNLTLKVVQAIKYLVDNEKCSFVLKADDDSFARLDLLTAELANISLEKWLYWGYFTGRASVYHKGRWAENNWFLCDRYLPYARGGGYVFSGGLAKFIGDSANVWERYVNEDVSFGAWTAGLVLKRVHDPRFDTEYLSRGCLDSYLVTHKQKPEDMRQKINHLRKTGRLCEVEGEVRPGYEYDWRLPPSQCCDQAYKEPRRLNEVRKNNK